VFEAMPKLRGLDGFREGVPMMDPGQIDDGDDEGLEYKCEEEWYSPDIYLTTSVAKEKFQKAQQSSKEEIDIKAALKECEIMLQKKTNVLTL
jgi:hypothetical protein